MIREPFRGTWRPISLDRMQSGAFYDSTRWRCAKGLPPRDKCCHPFRSQLTRTPPFTRSHYRGKPMNRSVNNFPFRDPRRFTPDTIIAWTGSLSASLLFARWSMRSVLSILFRFPPRRISFSLSTGGFHSVGRGPKRNSEMGIVVGIIAVSIGRSVRRIAQWIRHISAGWNSYGTKRCNPTHRPSSPFLLWLSCFLVKDSVRRSCGRGLLSAESASLTWKPSSSSRNEVLEPKTSLPSLCFQSSILWNRIVIDIYPDHFDIWTS